jgi:hypothetical protein
MNQLAMSTRPGSRSCARGGSPEATGGCINGESSRPFGRRWRFSCCGRSARLVCSTAGGFRRRIQVRGGQLLGWRPDSTSGRVEHPGRLWRRQLLCPRGSDQGADDRLLSEALQLPLGRRPYRWEEGVGIEMGLKGFWAQSRHRRRPGEPGRSLEGARDAAHKY